MGWGKRVDRWRREARERGGRGEKGGGGEARLEWGVVGGGAGPCALDVLRAALHDSLPPPLEAHDEPQQLGGAEGAEQLEDSPVSNTRLLGQLALRRPLSAPYHATRLPRASASLGQSAT